MDAGGDVGPPQKGLRMLRAVIESYAQFDYGLARTETDAVHTLHTGHRIVVAAPDGDRAVRFTLDSSFDPHEGGGAMMLRPVELDSTGDPRSS